MRWVLWSEAVIADLSSLISIPKPFNDLQNLKTTARRHCRPAAEQTTRTRLSTTQRADVCRLEMVLWPTPVAFNAQMRAYKIMQKSRDSSLPCFLRRVRWIDADLA